MSDTKEKPSCFGVILSCQKYIKSRAVNQNTDELPFDFRYFVGGKEEKDNNKIITLKCADNYESLHHKVYKSIKWVDENVDYDYILKTDDDIPFDKEKIENIYKKITEGSYDYCGYFSSIKTGYNSTWHFGKCEDETINKTQVYCPATYYAAGGAYFLSKKFVKQYLNNFQNTDQSLIFEDVFMGVSFAECLKKDSSLKILSGLNKEILQAFKWA